MAPRVAPVVAASFVLLLVAACGASAAPSSAAPAPVATIRVPEAEPVTSVAPAPTPVPVPLVTAWPDAGNVDGGGSGPELTIEMVDSQTIRATLDDRSAEAWRLVVAGVGKRAGDRWEILVEVGDVAPAITATEVRDGHVVDVMDLSGLADGTAAAGGCHGTLPVCLSSDGPAGAAGSGHAAGDHRRHGHLAGRAVRAGPVDGHRAVPVGRDKLTRRTDTGRAATPRRDLESAGGPGQNRTATAEGEGFTDPWAHHLPDRPTMVEMRGLEPLASAMRTRRSPS